MIVNRPELLYSFGSSNYFNRVCERRPVGERCLGVGAVELSCGAALLAASHVVEGVARLKRSSLHNNNINLAERPGQNG